ncbi:MAG: adenylate/guanylate cyclase domain-containing protein [Gaiellaceae bacterium]
MARQDLPRGTVTFLFTDVEGSTQLLDELGEAGYAEALAEHRRALRAAFAAHGGVEVDTQGDAFFYAFGEPAGAVAAALDAQSALVAGPIRVRMGLHTGEPVLTHEGYVGRDVHLGARVAAAGHGGQVLLSPTTRAVVDAEALDLGEHRLKDFAEPVGIFQLGSETFPPLKTISNTNLPRPASSFVGRAREVAEIGALLRDGARLLTLTGPGGTGKTRLAIEAASELVSDFRHGVFWVGLATLRDPALVAETVAQALGARGALAEHVGEREVLLLLDNLEHVVEAAPELASLVEACPNLRLLVTSRELLRVRGEVEYPVVPLAPPEAVELFSSRARLEPDATVEELCRRLDSLPLAVELAAARASVLSPAQILQRLSESLDLLRGGRDADPRQQTLRATIEWSHELLAPDEQRLFARLAVFHGGYTVEATEEVARADLDALQSLVEKSLLRHTEERFWMLETIRDYAAERLEESGEAPALRSAHAEYFRAFADREDAWIRSGEPEEVAVARLEPELDNLRAAFAFGLDAGDAALVRGLAASLPIYWIVRGLYGEARAWLDRALAADPVEDDTRRRLLAGLATIAYGQGDHPVAVAASDQAASLAAKLGGATERIDLLRDQAVAALRRGNLDEAEALFRERLDVAIAVDNGVVTSSCRLNLATIANKRRRHELAEGLLAENLPFVRSKGQTRCEANTLAAIAQTAFLEGRPQDCADEALLGAILALRIGDTPLAAWSLDLVAAAAAARGEVRRAGIILGATEAARKAMGVDPGEDEEAIRVRALELAGRSGEELEQSWSEGRALDLQTAAEFASEREGVGARALPG